MGWIGGVNGLRLIGGKVFTRNMLNSEKLSKLGRSGQGKQSSTTKLRVIIPFWGIMDH